MTCWWSQCHWWCKVLFEECPSLGGHYDIEWYWYWCLLRYWHCIGGGTIRHHWPEANTSIARIRRSRSSEWGSAWSTSIKSLLGSKTAVITRTFPGQQEAADESKSSPSGRSTGLTSRLMASSTSTSCSQRRSVLSLDDKIQRGMFFGQKCPFKSYLGAKTWAIARYIIFRMVWDQNMTKWLKA